MNRRRRIVQNLGLALAAVGVTLAILEIALRIYFTHFGNERQYLMYVASREELNSRTAILTGLPFLNYGLNTTHPDHNSLGYRGRESPLVKSAGVFRIVALGGSTTYGVFIENAEDAYPAQLERILREDYGHDNVEVVNAGAPGYNSWESFINFSFRVLDLHPDMIIFYEAVNDVSARLADPAFFDGLNSGRGIWQFTVDPLPPSVLYRFIAIKLGAMADPRTIENHVHQPAAFSSCILTTRDNHDFCENFGVTPEALLATNPPIYFERNLRNLVTVANQHDVIVMLSTWAYSPERFDHAGGDFMTHAFLQEGVAEHNAIIRRIASDMDTLLYDFASNLEPSHGWWVDGLHFNPTGAGEQARQYATFIHEQGVIPQYSAVSHLSRQLHTAGARRSCP